MNYYGWNQRNIGFYFSAKNGNEYVKHNLEKSNYWQMKHQQRNARAYSNGAIKDQPNISVK